MRTVSKALGAILTAAASAAAAPARGQRRDREPGRSPRRRRPVAASATGPTAGRCPSPAARPYYEPVTRRQLRRLHRHGRELGAHGGLHDRQLPRLVTDQRRPGEHQLHQVPRRHRHRRLLVHGRPRRRPALERHHRRRRPTWGALQAARTLTAIKGRTVTYPVVWADIELPGIAPAPDNGWNSVYTSPCSEHVSAEPTSRRPSTGRSSTGSRPTSPRTPRTRSASTPRPRSGTASSGPAARHASRTPTSGPTCPRPRTCRRAPPAGACTARRRAPVLRRADRRRASTR